jgi:hypothetical protein
MVHPWQLLARGRGRLRLPAKREITILVFTLQEKCLSGFVLRCLAQARAELSRMGAMPTALRGHGSPRGRSSCPRRAVGMAHGARRTPRAYARVPCPRPCVGMTPSRDDPHAHAEPWAWHTAPGVLRELTHGCHAHGLAWAWLPQGTILMPTPSRGHGTRRPEFSESLRSRLAISDAA